MIILKKDGQAVFIDRVGTIGGDNFVIYPYNEL